MLSSLVDYRVMGSGLEDICDVRYMEQVRFHMQKVKFQEQLS